MARLLLCISMSVALLAIPYAMASASAPDPIVLNGEVVAYYDGRLVSINLKLLPEHTWGPLSRHGHLNDFYSGFICYCPFPADSAGVCACFQETAVLSSLHPGLYRAFSVYWGPDGPYAGGYTTFSQVKTAVADGSIRIVPERGVYRLTLCKQRSGSPEHAGPSSDGGGTSLAEHASPQESTTWGAVKALFR